MRDTSPGCEEELRPTLHLLWQSNLVGTGEQDRVIAAIPLHDLRMAIRVRGPCRSDPWVTESDSGRHFAMDFQAVNVLFSGLRDFLGSGCEGRLVCAGRVMLQHDLRHLQTIPTYWHLTPAEKS